MRKYSQVEKGVIIGGNLLIGVFLVLALLEVILDIPFVEYVYHQFLGKYWPLFCFPLAIVGGLIGYWLDKRN